MPRVQPLVTPASLLISPVDYCAAIGGNAGSGNFTVSTAFYATKSGVILSGIRARVAFSGGGTKNLKLSLYSTAGTSPIVTDTISSVATGTNIQSTFSSPQTLTAGTLYYAAAYETGGAIYLKYAVSNSVFPAGASLVPWAKDLIFAGFLWVAGDARPATGTTSEFYGVEPVVQ